MRPGRLWTWEEMVEDTNRQLGRPRGWRAPGSAPARRPAAAAPRSPAPIPSLSQRLGESDADRQRRERVARRLERHRVQAEHDRVVARLRKASRSAPARRGASPAEFRRQLRLRIAR